MTTDPYEIARRIAREKMAIDIEGGDREQDLYGRRKKNIRDALLAAIEEGRRLGAEEKAATSTADEPDFYDKDA